MGVIVFGRTQLAQNTPFDNATNGFTATDVQAAIEETLLDAINNDRYPIQANYNGNANIGRYLEVFPGEDSLAAPLLSPSNSKIVQITIQAVAVSTGSIEIYNITTATVLYTASFSGAAKQTFNNLSIAGIAAGNELGFRVSGASINKPKIRAWFNTQI